MKRSTGILLVLVLLVSSILVGCGITKGTAEWHSAQGDKLIELGLYDEAIEEYTKAIKLEPSMPPPYYSRGFAYKLQGQKAEAIADFEKFITLTDNPQWIEMARQHIEELQSQ